VTGRVCQRGGVIWGMVGAMRGDVMEWAADGLRCLQDLQGSKNVWAGNVGVSLPSKTIGSCSLDLFACLNQFRQHRRLSFAWAFLGDVPLLAALVAHLGLYGTTPHLVGPPAIQTGRGRWGSVRGNVLGYWLSLCLLYLFSCLDKRGQDWDSVPVRAFLGDVTLEATLVADLVLNGALPHVVSTPTV
jgi:hypothetical protein